MPFLPVASANRNRSSLPRRRNRPLAALSFLVIALAPFLAAAETLTIGGTGSGLGALRILAEEFAKGAPGVSVVLLPNKGSSGGIKALAAGAIDAAVISRPLTEQERTLSHVALEYGKTPFVLASRNPPAQGFKTLADIADLYGNERPVWPDGSAVRLIMRPRNDIDTTLLESFSPAVRQAVQTAMARPGLLVRATDQEAADAIENTPGAIGPTTLALILSEQRKLGPWSINGVMPSTKTLADGSYPFSKSMTLVRKPDGKQAVVQLFEFIESPKGRQLLANLGHLPPPGK